MFLHITNLSISYVIFILIRSIIGDSTCIYDVEDGLQLDIRTLGFANGKGPKYDRISNTNPASPLTFSWNGCFSYSTFDQGNCTNAAACYYDSTLNVSIVIAKQDSVQFQYQQGSSVLSYQFSHIYLTVFLICRDEDEDTVLGRHDDAMIYNLYIQSRCCCPGMCHYSTHSISPILIVIIIVGIFLFGYIIGGIIVLRYNRNHLWCCLRRETINIDYQEI